MSLIASQPENERLLSVRRMAPTYEDKLRLLWKWSKWRARREQLPPDSDTWLVWLLLAGRGFGKTRTGAQTVGAEVEAGRAKRIALVAPTAADVRNVMVEGESGILAVSPPWCRPVYEPSKRRLTWPNGAVAECYSADEPERLRGPQHDFAWCDELSSWRYSQAWDMLMFGLRLGERPRVVVTTTPKPTRLIRDLAAAPTTVLTRGSTFANQENLAPSFLSVILGKYQGTRLGRQEIDAELLDQADGALWTRAGIESARIAPDEMPQMKRIVVAIDPAVTAGAGSDETGIVVAGLGVDGLVYVLADASGRFTPDEWGRRAVNLYADHKADRIVGETNNGGEMVEIMLRTVDPNVAYKGVIASKGKRTRAEPVSALYEQSRVKHAGAFPTLEDQMCNWSPTSGEGSPDRVDALVWAVTELKLQPADTGLLDFYRDRAGRVGHAPL